jgi:serine/threonine-protein kinase
VFHLKSRREMEDGSLPNFEILDEIGRGGMGVVYKARDKRLGRIVAIKFLPDYLSADPDAKARFVHEGRAASALDHSSICTIYEIGETSDGRLFMVMAYVDGQPLSHMIKEGPLPLQRVIQMAIQIADGLGHSHEKGVTHRDMKPGNVIVQPDGTVKILDFGLAKLLGATVLTKTGTTLGTAAYMSPEQIQAAETDHRTDIWALGAMIYEMVSGRRPFSGEYEQALSYAIVNETPEPLTAVRTGVPVEFDRVVLKALAKDPAERYQRMDELIVDLRALMKTLDGNKSSRVRSQSETKRRRISTPSVIPWAIALAASLFAVFFYVREPRESNRLLRTTIPTEPIPLGERPLASPIALSPDGTKLVYEVIQGGSRQLYLRRLDSYITTAIAGTEGGYAPFFSPDGMWVAFFANGQLKKTSLLDGSSLVLCEVPLEVTGGDWGPHGRIVVSLAYSLVWVPESGGEREEFFALQADARESELGWPEILHDGETVLFNTMDASGRNSTLWATSIRGSEKTRLTEGGYARYLRSGHIVFPRSGALWVAPFSPRRRRFLGEPRVAVQGLITEFTMNPEFAVYDVTDDGVLVYIGGEQSTGGSSLKRIHRDGRVDILSTEPLPFLGIRASPDGRRIVTTAMDREGNRQTQIYDLQRQSWSRFKYESQTFWPFWSRDGSTLFFTIFTPGEIIALGSQPSDGSRSPHIVWQDSALYNAHGWYPDDTQLIVARSLFANPLATFGIWTLPLDGAPPRVFFDTPRTEIHPAISPDGRWMAYASTSSDDYSYDGRLFDVFVRPTDGSERRWQVSSGGGWAPIWSRDGNRIYFESTFRIVSTEWMAEPQIGAGAATTVFEGTFLPSVPYGRNYDVGPEGEVYILDPEVVSEVTSVKLVTGWSAELHMGNE